MAAAAAASEEKTDTNAFVFFGLFVCFLCLILAVVTFRVVRFVEMFGRHVTSMSPRSSG